MKETASVQFRLPTETIERMDAAAARRGLGRGDIAREAIANHLQPSPADALANALLPDGGANDPLSTRMANALDERIRAVIGENGR